MKEKVLNDKDISKHIKNLPDWTLNKHKTQLSKTFLFKNFVTALSFCAKIAVHSEVLNHHPNLELSHDKVKVKLKTVSLKGLTKLDFELAKRIDELQIK